jgi:hypothetical protein
MDSFRFFFRADETGKTLIICRMWERPPASSSTRYIGLYWMRRKSAPMRIAKPALRRGSHFPTSSHLRASRFFFFLSFFFDFLSSSVCLFYIFNGSQMATNFFISPFGSFNLLSGAHLFYLFRSAFFLLFLSGRNGGNQKRNSFTFSLRYVTC